MLSEELSRQTYIGHLFALDDHVARMGFGEVTLKSNAFLTTKYYCE
jgi:hypothetical protein